MRAAPRSCRRMPASTPRLRSIGHTVTTVTRRHESASTTEASIVPATGIVLSLSEIMSEDQLLFLVFADLDQALAGELLRHGDDPCLRIVDVAQLDRAKRGNVVLQQLGGAVRHALEEQLAQLFRGALQGKRQLVAFHRAQQYLHR